MTSLILHHYAGSPFSEKIRLILGFKGLAWQSVVVPSIMPKPDVLALTGGYRRTPFMQIGADIYCDTALMCRVIDRLQPHPPLYPEPYAGLADIIAQWADTSFFWIAVPYTLQPASIPHMFPEATPEFMKAFGADRAAMNPSLRRATVADGRAQLDTYLDRLTSLLADGRPFLLGALPSIADFSVAHSIWFIHRAPPIAAMFDARETLRVWYQRVKAFGHGTWTEITSSDAIAAATAAQAKAPTRFEGGTDLAEGDVVTVTPTDYAYDPVAGTLVGLTGEEVVIRRDDERASGVHVHFPRIGFQIRKAAV